MLIIDRQLILLNREVVYRTQLHFLKKRYGNGRLRIELCEIDEPLHPWLIWRQDYCSNQSIWRSIIYFRYLYLHGSCLPNVTFVSLSGAVQIWNILIKAWWFYLCSTEGAQVSISPIRVYIGFVFHYLRPSFYGYTDSDEYFLVQPLLKKFIKVLNTSSFHSWRGYSDWQFEHVD